MSLEESAEKLPLRIQFADFFPRCEAFLRWALSKRFQLVDTFDRPELLFFSDFGNSHLAIKAKTKLYFTGENKRPNYELCDFAVSFDRSDDERNFRLPLYVIENHSRWQEYGAIDRWDAILNPKDPEKILKEKTEFCNFVVSNPKNELRNAFFELLSRYRKVSSAGNFANNIGRPLAQNEEDFFRAKLQFQSKFKFSIAFENSCYPGYVTEKILDPMLVQSLPIYWGDPSIGEDFEEASFINAQRFRTLKELVDWIVEVDRNDDLYRKYLKAPYLKNNEMSSSFDLQRLLDFIETSISKKAD